MGVRKGEYRNESSNMQNDLSLQSLFVIVILIAKAD
jgi:hypothetical protein